MSKKNSSFKWLVSAGIVLFAIVTYVIVSSTATVSAVVPKQEISAGTKIESGMLQSIKIPVNTPKGYITDVSSLVGQKLKVTVDENQLLYINNVMSSWEDFSDGEAIPDDYIVTSMQIPSERAVGGLLTAGDVVDILGIPNNNYATIENDLMAKYLGDVAKVSYGAEGINLYWILANVKILETDSDLSKSTNSSISIINAEDTTSSAGNYYIVALSYSDYQKLRLAEQYLDLWLNIAPAFNDENAPLLDIMQNCVPDTLKDAKTQSILVPKDTASTDTSKIVTPTGSEGTTKVSETNNTTLSPTAIPTTVSVNETTSATTSAATKVTLEPTATVTPKPTATPKPTSKP